MARIAFMTYAVLAEVWDDPANKGFRERIDAAVRTLEQSSGFIASDFDESPAWGEMQTPRVLDRPEFADRFAVTLSLWEDLESVFAYAYHAAHGESLRHRHEWFIRGEWPVYVAWWVADDQQPTWAEAIARYDSLHERGPAPEAFDFKQPFDANGSPVKLDRERAKAKATELPLIDWREDTGEAGAS